MKSISVYFILLLCSSILAGCQKDGSPAADVAIFDSVPVVHPLSPMVNEISGIADSKANAGFLWGHEDSGTQPQIFLVKHDGVVTKKIHIKGINNRDWEDMSLSGNDIYIGEIGDNTGSYQDYKFYKFPEPPASADTVFSAETISFNYPDGSHDAEAFIVDPVSKDIYIITKRDDPSAIYKLDHPYGATNTVSFVASLPYTGVVSATISPDGTEIIVKTYTSLYHYKRKSGQSLAAALQNVFTKLKYTIEPQGEAVCFSTSGAGFFTLSEKGFANWVNLYYYKRN